MLYPRTTLGIREPIGGTIMEGGATMEEGICEEGAFIVPITVGAEVGNAELALPTGLKVGKSVPNAVGAEVGSTGAAAAVRVISLSLMHLAPSMEKWRVCPAPTLCSPQTRALIASSFTFFPTLKEYLAADPSSRHKEWRSFEKAPFSIMPDVLDFTSNRFNVKDTG